MIIWISCSTTCKGIRSKLSVVKPIPVRSVCVFGFTHFGMSMALPLDGGFSLDIRHVIDQLVDVIGHLALSGTFQGGPNGQSHRQAGPLSQCFSTRGASTPRGSWWNRRGYLAKRSYINSHERYTAQTGVENHCPRPIHSFKCSWGPIGAHSVHFNWGVCDWK